MTAEIAILNKSAVALAADSVGVATAPRRRSPVDSAGIANDPHRRCPAGVLSKTYNSLEKIFPLNNAGIMVYGSAQLAGIPLETLIEEFRRADLIANCRHLVDYADVFKQYIVDRIAPTFETYSLIVELQLSGILQDAQESMLYRLISEEHPTKEISIGIAIDEVCRVLRDRIFSLQELSTPHNLEGITGIDQDKRDTCFYNASTYVKDFFSYMFEHHLKCGDIKKALSLAGRSTNTLIRTFVDVAAGPSFMFGEETGFVFAGFGPEDTFPSLHAFQISGIEGGKVKEDKDRAKNINICPHVREAAVEAFADTQMVKRFLTGFDDPTMDYVISAVDGAIAEFSEQAIGKYAKQGKMERALADAASKKETCMTELKSRFEKWNQYQRKEILDIVKFMPKDVLHSMAETLVNLTLAKRRVSFQRETAAGPVDVALISKTDGFVWVKKKQLSIYRKELDPKSINV